MECFKDRHFMTELDEIASNRKTGRTGPDNGNLLSGRWCDLRYGNFPLCPLIVGNETLEPPDCNGFCLFTANALYLTLNFLRTDSSAHSRKRICFFNLLCRADKITLCNQGYEPGDIDLNRTTVNTGRVFALYAPQSLKFCHIRGKSERNLVKVAGTHLWILLGHWLTRDFHSFFHFHLTVPPFLAVCMYSSGPCIPFLRLNRCAVCQ